MTQVQLASGQYHNYWHPEKCLPWAGLVTVRGEERINSNMFSRIPRLPRPTSPPASLLLSFGIRVMLPRFTGFPLFAGLKLSTNCPLTRD